MYMINTGQTGIVTPDVEYEKLRSLDPCMYNNWGCFKDAPKLVITHYQKLRLLLVWINKNISIRIDINDVKTDRVLVRIAVGMLEKIDIPKDDKIDLCLAFLRSWREARHEWLAFQLKKNSEGLPF